MTRRRLSIVALACLGLAPATHADVTFDLNVNQWLGSGDFNDSANWNWGLVAGSPDNGLPIYFGTVHYLFNGIPAGYLYPDGPAVLDGTFNAPDLRMCTGTDTHLTINGSYTSGSYVYVGRTPINDHPTSDGMATVKLDGLLEASFGTVYIGYDSQGTLDVCGPSSVPSLRLAHLSGSLGILNIGAGGSLSGNFTTGDGTAVLNNSGMLSADGFLNLVGHSYTGSSNSTLEIVGVIDIDASFINAGTISFAGDTQNSGDESLYIHGVVALDSQGEGSGSAEVILREQDNSEILNGGSGYLVNVDHLIRGTGEIQVDMTNHATVRAEGGQLVVQDIDNTNGTIEIGSDGTIRAEGFVTAGSILSDPGGTIFTAGSGSRLVDPTLSGHTTIANDLRVEPALTNTDTLTFVGDSESDHCLTLHGVVTLEGGGEIVLVEQSVDYRHSIITDGGAGYLVNTDNTIRGTGEIRVDVTNNALIRAEGGQLEIFDIDNTNGTIEIASDGTLFTEHFITGGNITCEPGSVLHATSSNSRLVDTTLHGVTSISRDLRVESTLTNFGVLTFTGDAPTSDQDLILHGVVTLDGGGEIVLVEQQAEGRYSVIGNGGSGHLVNTDNTVRGTGEIKVDVTNNALIRAEGGQLEIFDIDNTDGTIEIDDGSLLRLTSGYQVTGGVISGFGTLDANLFECSSTIHPGAAPTGDPAASVGTLTIDGTTQLHLPPVDDPGGVSQSTLVFEIATSAGDDHLLVNAGITLGGTIELVHGPLASGAQFTLIDATSMSGTFDCIRGPGIYNVEIIDGEDLRVTVISTSGCTGDLPGISPGNVDVADLLALLSAWGPVGEDVCVQGADLDGDDAVGVTDLLTLLAAWGPCV